jgi:Protein of unknown function (DUF3352)
VTDPAQPVGPPGGAGVPHPSSQPAAPQPAYPPSPWADANTPTLVPGPQPVYGARSYGPPAPGPSGSTWTPPYPMAGGYPPLAPAPRRRRGPLVIAAVVVMVVLLGGGAYAGLSAWYGWGANEPESAVPAGALAFARLDLDPGYSEQLKLAGVLSKFPKPDSGTQVEQVEHGLLDDLGLDFNTDIKPWFADRVGFAAWIGHGGRPVALVALASKDDGKASSALESARTGRTRFGYTVKNGYALLALGGAEAQADADAARAAVDKQSLADSERFSVAMDRLPGAHVALVYVDLAAAGAAANGALGDLLPTEELGTDAPDLSKLTGTVALTADAAANGVEVRFAGTGLAPATNAGSDAKAALDAQPGTSIVAGAMSGLNPDASVTDSLRGMINGSLFGDPTYRSGPSRAQVRDLADGLVAFLTARTISFAFTKLDAAGPSGLVSADTRDSAAADKVDAAVRLLMQDAPPSARVTVEKQGTTVRIRIGNPDLSGRLADRSLYREAMAGMPDRPGSAFYADVQQLVASDRSMTNAERRQIAPFKAVGFAVSQHGDTVDGLLRVVIR